jgi:hypothetical protein
MVSPFLRPVAIRDTSTLATAPDPVVSVAHAASSTVTGSGPSSPVRESTNVRRWPLAAVTGSSSR